VRGGVRDHQHSQVLAVLLSLQVTCTQVSTVSAAAHLLHHLKHVDNAQQILKAETSADIESA
jgi:hypothetical protein